MLLWTNPATSNRFGAKHIQVAPDGATLEQLVMLGRNIYAKRVRSFDLGADPATRHGAEAQELKAKYGNNISPDENTLMVFTASGLAKLTTDISANGFASGEYAMPQAVIFNTNGAAHRVGLMAKATLDVRPAGANHEVYHLRGATIVAPLPWPTQQGARQTTLKPVPGDADTMGLKFTPSTAELATAKGGLKATGGPADRGIPHWAKRATGTINEAEVTEKTGLDFSFMDG